MENTLTIVSKNRKTKPVLLQDETLLSNGKTIRTQNKNCLSSCDYYKEEFYYDDEEDWMYDGCLLVNRRCEYKSQSGIYRARCSECYKIVGDEEK